ncbi:alpha/beta fold hydrolase [Virgibacillus salinus]|uniref:Pimeloyl-ACP methyl ester carboxylesterase n=1 Tax=Virgibacillus salinus TaxID=553311 RepID=A0A1H0XZC7_9BACI|nr:alpha/beta hydrolase [Virgibacillus salinus]SDQ08264.1 Pimeloyl-ACP methyl ester carboxylesterase [Virgibacillus salinus]
MESGLYEWGNRENTTLVCLHGMGSTGLSFGELAHYLAEYHVVSFDLARNGSDKSLSEEEAYKPSCMAEEVEKVVKVLDKSKIYLVGHSWGAHLALYFAKAYPEQVQGVILLDGGYIQQPGNDSLEEELIRMEDFHNSIRFPSWEAFIESEKREMPRWSTEIEAAAKAQVTEINGEIRLALPASDAKAILKGIYAEPTKDVLEKITCPVLLLRSTLPEEMEGLRQQQANDFLENTPNAQVRLIPNTTHDIYRDSPGEVSRNIREWIQETAY